MYRRAPFIWTAKQPIDAAGAFRVFFETAGAARRRDRTAGSSSAGALTFPVRADAARAHRYRRRPLPALRQRRSASAAARCAAIPLYQRTDTYDLRSHVKAGANVIALLVHVYGVDTAWYQVVHGHWQPVFGDGALYCDGSVRCGDTIIDVLSDEHWRCIECSAWERDTPRANWGLGFIEVHDARQMPDGWTQPEFDDSAWDAVQVLSVGGGPPDSMLGGLKIEPFPTLLPRDDPVPRRVSRRAGARRRIVRRSSERRATRRPAPLRRNAAAAAAGAGRPPRRAAACR